jgi:mono/diheme cytochrome c family protein
MRWLITTALLICLGTLAAPARGQQDSPAVQRGKAVFHATGGCSCHTEVKNQGPFMAGGRPIATPFGHIYATNITPDTETGIGSWSETDFINAMTKGMGPDGKHYYPVFPYTSFTRMTRQDLLDLRAYLLSIPPVRKANPPNPLRFPFSWRGCLAAWKWLYFQPGAFRTDAAQSAQWNRGAYLVNALAHCGECHTPRILMGGPKTSMRFAGAVDGPEGELAPNLTPHEATGIGDWSLTDVVWYLQTGLKPDGDDTQGLMSEMIEHGFQHVPEADLQAIAVYIRSLEPIDNKVVPKDESQ